MGKIPHVAAVLGMPISRLAGFNNANREIGVPRIPEFILVTSRVAIRSHVVK